MTRPQRDKSQTEEERRDRALTDADIRALTDEIETRIVNMIDKGLGQGVRAFLWKIIFFGLMALIAYGISKGIK